MSYWSAADMGWLDSPPCGGSYLQEQDACGEVASFSNFALCDGEALCEYERSPAPPPSSPPVPPLPSLPPSPSPPPLPPPSPPSPQPPSPSPSPPCVTPLPPHSPPPPPPPPQPSPPPPVLPPPSPPSRSKPLLPPPPSAPLQLAVGTGSGPFAPHLWSAALVVLSCAALFGVLCGKLCSRCRSAPGRRRKPAGSGRRRWRRFNTEPATAAVEPPSDATGANGAIKKRYVEDSATAEDADPKGGLLLPPQRTSFSLFVMRVRRWLGRPLALMPTGRSTVGPLDRQASAQGSTLAEAYGLE